MTRYTYQRMFEYEDTPLFSMKEITMSDKARVIQIDNGGIQYRRGDQVWTLVASAPGQPPYTLERRDGAYVQYSEEWDSKDAAIRSAEEIAPLSEWEAADW